MATNTVKVELVGNDKSLGKTFRGASTSASRFGDRMKKMAKVAAAAFAAIAIGVGVALTAAFVKGVKEAGQFEAEMDKIRGLVGANAQQMALYEDAILDAGAAYGTNAHAAAEAMYFITGVGFKGKLAVDVLNTTLKATATGLGDAADVAKALTRVISVYGKKNITAAKSADILTAAVNYGNMEADELAQNVGKVVPMAKKLGVTWDEVAGLMAASSLVLDVDEAAVSLNAFWTAIIKPSAEGKKALEDVGLSYADLRKIVKERGTLDAMRAMETAFGGNVDEMVKVIGNVRAMRGMFTMLGMDAKQVDEILKNVKNSTGALDKAWDKVSTGTGVKFKQVTEGLRSVMIKLGSAALPAVKEVLDEITTVWLPKFSDWVGAHKEEIKNFFIKIAAKVKDFGQYLIDHEADIVQVLNDVGAAAEAVYKVVKGIVDALRAMDEWLGSASTPQQQSDIKKVLGVPDRVMAEGGILTKPEVILGGEDGPEAIVPLTKPARAAEVLAEAGLLGGGGPSFTNCTFIGSPPKEWVWAITKGQRVMQRRIARGYA